MRARYTDLDGTDAVDGVANDENLLAGKISMVSEVEPVAPTSVADPYPSYEEIVVDDNIIEGVYDFSGIALGGILPIVDLIKYDHPLVATPTPDNDTLYGTDGADTIDGGDGADTIYGRGGHDLLLGGAGDDLLLGEDGNDRLEGGDGTDYLYGQNGDDVIFGDAGNDVIFGHLGIDHLYGGDGIDRIDGGEGIDYLSGQGGDDRLIGGDDNDMLWGAEGDDRLDGGDGYDWLEGGDGNDTLHGWNHADNLHGGAGDDILHGDDRYGSGLFVEEVGGVHGADALFGEDGNDRLYGAGGDDQLYGGEGYDILNGGSGADQIDGGAGADRMLGEGGRDVFVFSDRLLQGPGHFEVDTIMDFDFVTNDTSFSGDWLDLRQMFDKYTNFAGTTANEAWAQGYLYLIQYGNPGETDFGTRVYMDPNGHAADPTTYYQYHDIAVVDLQGVARSDFDAYNQEAAFLSKYILV